MPGNEVDLEEDVCDTAERRWGVLHLKLNVRGKTGFPDRLFFIPGGRPLLIEFKRPGEEPEWKQLYIHAQLIARGYDVQSHDNKEAALRAIQAALESATPPPASCKVLAESLLSRIAPRSGDRQDKRHTRRKQNPPR